MRRRGFTIVELLIVIVVIGILATLILVGYRSISTQATAGVIQGDLTQAGKQLGIDQERNNAGSGYPATLAAANNGQGLVASAGTSYQYYVNNNVSPAMFCITATNKTQSMYLTSPTVVSPYVPSTTPTAGACPGQGANGDQPITNLSYNPDAVLNTNGYAPWAGTTGSVSYVRQAVSWSTRGFAVRSTWTAANSSFNGDTGWSIGNAVNAYSLQPNTAYVARWKIATSKPQRMAPSMGNWVIAGGASGSGSGTVNATSPTVVTTANTATDQWIKFTTGTGTIGGKLFSSLTSGTGATTWAVGDYLDISDLIIYQGTTLYNFADGASPGWIWNGSANASTSTGTPQ